MSDLLGSLLVASLGGLCAVVGGILLGRWWVRRRTPAPPPVDGATPIPERWEYKVLLSLVPGERDLAYLAGALWPTYRTDRPHAGRVPEKAKHTLRAVLAPMLARGWVRQVDKGNPGLWAYEITDTGYAALKRCPPPVEVWQPSAPEPLTRPARLRDLLGRAFARRAQERE
jgi:hypothetical protein